MSIASQPGINFENLFTYTPMQHDIVSHVLTLGFVAHAAGLVYFAFAQKDIHPKLRTATIFSCFIMAAAALNLFRQFSSWNDAFNWTGSYYEIEQTFSNGFRYFNWFITLPLLLTQPMFVFGIRGKTFVRNTIIFVAASIIMVWTGYIGQMHEVTSSFQYWFWFMAGSIAYIPILWLLYEVYFVQRDQVPVHVVPMVRKLFFFQVLSWTVYLAAYLMPVFSFSADGAVVRHILYTIADIFSKLIYGVWLSYIALKISAHKGYQPAKDKLGAVSTGSGEKEKTSTS
ncbi:rhodopsin [Alteribacter lacisalsi]|uniref:Rhodopsin n=1 Tax=Alteribacter lacisalsi TaxID=2045244 RepID=A0A2W0HUG2_9BACI|nr:bacteriorhodopsin [Alteribacter lacisalsi]PYZ97288.1 rhodopsin [Alteribacter lacisalsi]